LVQRQRVKKAAARAAVDVIAIHNDAGSPVDPEAPPLPIKPRQAPPPASYVREQRGKAGYAPMLV
jgi:hypothetical protein